MRRLVPSVLPALVAALLVVGGCGGDDDLTVAVAEDVRGARIDAAPGASDAPGDVAVETAPAVEDDAAAAPAGELPPDSGREDPYVPPPIEHEPDAGSPTVDESDVDAPADDVATETDDVATETDDVATEPGTAAAATSGDAPAMPLGDVPTASDEVKPPAVEETPIPADEDDSLDIPIPDEDDWKPEPPKPPVFQDGEWNTSFDYLGSFDVGIDALDPGSALAQHTPRMPVQEGAPEPEKGIPEAVHEMDGQKVRIEGYMIPLKFEDGAVKTFFLSRYMMGCCFGVLPKANEVIEIEMVGEKGAYYDAYMPFIVVGTFEIVEDGTSPEFLQSVFRIKADSCDYAEDW